MVRLGKMGLFYYLFEWCLLWRVMISHCESIRALTVLTIADNFRAVSMDIVETSCGVNLNSMGMVG